MASWILVPWPGIEPSPLCSGSNHWTTREVPITSFYVCVCVCVLLLLFSLSVVSNSFATLWTVTFQASLPWDSPRKNTGMGCHSLLQGIFLTQGSNLCLLHWQMDSLPLSNQGSPMCMCVVLCNFRLDSTVLQTLSFLWSLWLLLEFRSQCFSRGGV